MRKILVLLFSLVILISLTAAPTFAIDDPVTFNNNRFGIHIFDIEELEKVPDLVNSNGGEWGYVTVPIREDQRDREKWQGFMQRCRELKLIPIVRLATTMQTYGWSEPTEYTPIDFANFLNDLDWPIKNRYIAVYNEPNHAHEWGGAVNPEEYAQELERAIQIFKDRNDDFFILGAGFDAAAPNDGVKHMRWDTFMQRMYRHRPDVFKKLDGWNSHSYPNHAFSGSPNDRHDHSIVSFIHELELAERYAGKNFPIFITETGWVNTALSDETIARYYEIAFETVWNNSEIIAITPFVLHAGAGPFAPFSLKDAGGNPKPQYLALQSFPKVKGEPNLNKDDDEFKLVAGEEVNRVAPYADQSQPFVYDKWGDVLDWVDWF